MGARGTSIERRQVIDLVLGLISEGREAKPPPGIPEFARKQARNLLLRLARRKEEVLRFLNDPSIPFGNNLAEHDLRTVKRRQKVLGLLPHRGGREEVLPHPLLRLDGP